MPASSQNMAAAFAALEAEVRSRLAAFPSCHDWEHTARVLENARRLAAAEGADRTVVEFAALLHDIGRTADIQSKGRRCHARLGERITRELLPQFGITDPAFIERVAAAVRTHRWRDPARPESIEAKVVFDADKLDSLGAVGLARSFHFAGREGARIHNTESEALAAASYSRDDTAYREYLVKLRHLPAGMLTESGRAAARKRLAFMEAFFHELEREIGGGDLPCLS